MGPGKQRNFKPRHQKNHDRRFNGRKAIDSMYDSKWEAYRKRFLALNPECYACGQPSVVVDHLKPHKGDEKLFKKTDNHIPLCTKCHNTATMLFDYNYKIGGSISKKIEWLNRGRVPGSGRNPRRVKVLPSYE